MKVRHHPFNEFSMAKDLENDLAKSKKELLQKRVEAELENRKPPHSSSKWVRNLAKIVVIVLLALTIIYTWKDISLKVCKSFLGGRGPRGKFVNY